jgi:hypothetical protein
MTTDQLTRLIAALDLQGPVTPAQQDFVEATDDSEEAQAHAYRLSQAKVLMRVANAMQQAADRELAHR